MAGKQDSRLAGVWGVWCWDYILGLERTVQMTPYQRVEKIAEEIFQIRMIPLANSELKNIIAAQIEEAEREAVAEEHTKLFECECRVDDYAKGFNAAREKAAGIARDFDGASIKPVYDWVSTKAGIAKAIRAMGAGS